MIAPVRVRRPIPVPEGPLTIARRFCGGLAVRPSPCWRHG